MITDHKIIAEQWLESLPSKYKMYFVKLLQLDASVGKNVVQCALEYKHKYEEEEYLKYLSTLSYSDLKREYFKPGLIGWFKWLQFKNKAYYREHKEIYDALIRSNIEENNQNSIARKIEQATTRGMEIAINNANYDKQFGGLGAGSRSTTGAVRK